MPLTPSDTWPDSVFTQFRDLLGDESYTQLAELPGFQQVLPASEYVFQQCVRNAHEVLALQDEGLLQRALENNEMRARLDARLEGTADEQMLMQRLRRFRHQQLVRIIWRDIAGFADLDETLQELSSLADASVDAAVQWLFRQAVDKSGMPHDSEGNVQELIVVGMGKLGANELNLSSDIDLIFMYPARGQTDGRRGIDNEQFFTRLCRQLIRVIGEPTADGFVFRVDTRLRPFGDSGPLVVPLGFLEEYLQRQAREWERYAMVKARVISGSVQAAGLFYEIVRPFVYRRYLDYGAIEAIREMKSRIAREMHHRGMQRNIKLGLGGIREIEFIGQAFQLIRGGREKALQVRPVQQVLRILAELAMLPKHEADELLAAYRFLRLTENRLQAWRDEQTHLLPEDADGRQRLALAMNYSDWQSFDGDLQSHRNRVHGYFQLLFAAPQANDVEEGPFTRIWQGDLGDESGVQALQQAGFNQAAASWELLKRFRQSTAFRYLGENGRRRLDELMPLLLEALASTRTPDLLLTRMVPFLESISRRTAYLAMLVENPLLLSQFVRLIGESSWIAEQISRHPLLLDELIDPRRLYAPLKRAALEQELSVLLSAVEHDEEQYLERLRQFVQANILRVAAADVTEVIPVEVVSDHLTEIAEVACQAVYSNVLSFLLDRYGYPAQTVGAESGFAIIGYGKLGGFELGYSSDLDLVFVTDSEAANASTNGQKQVANEVFYARLGQRMIQQFTTRMPSGILYEVDMRLRPNGNAGLLVTSLAAFEKYQAEEAWTWEHQALVRARAIAGDSVTMQEFEAIRRRVLAQRRDVEALQREVREMREKMRASLDRSDSDLLDIKQGLGAIADIEFMVQYAVLRWACNHAGLLRWSDNARILETLAELKLLDDELASGLLSAYRAYRAEYHHLALQQQPGLVRRDHFSDSVALVNRAWRVLMIDPVA